MRKGISSLCGVVHEKMRSDVRNGDVFIFIGSSRKLMKLLHAEDGGMVMYVKRLEAGRFKLPEFDENTQSYQMEWRDLVVMVEGIQESPDQRLRRLRAQRRESAFKIVALLCKISRSETLFLVKYRILMLCFYVKYRVLRFFFVSLHPKYHRYG